jgi:alanine dehydrogenase
MIVGVPTEIKDNEYRVAMTPAGARELIERGHEICIQKGAGEGSSIPDEEFEAVGACMVPDAEAVWAKAEMIMKVKEPLEPEYPLLRDGQILFTYLHLAASEDLARALLGRGAVCIAYETVELPDGRLPLLAPMSEVAGRMAPQIGAQFLERTMGGRGVLLGGVSGVAQGEVLILGAGVVGSNAAHIAVGLGASVTVIDKNTDRLRHLDDIMFGKVRTLASNRHNIEEAVERADLVIGAVLVPGAKAPTLVTREMLSSMKPHAVIVDVAVDQGGCVETIHATTHSDPAYLVDDILHYGVANMPGAVPYTSTYALTNAPLPWAIELADKGYRRAAQENAPLALGINILDHKLTYRGVADAHSLEYTPLSSLIPTEPYRVI